MPDFVPINFSTDLTGRVALVTGASSGLGWRFSQVLAACGAKVVLTGRRRERLEALATEIGSSGGVALPVVLDVSQTREIASALDAAEQALGRVDILVNNAGMADVQWATKMSLEQIDQMFDTNLRGPWVLSTEVARRLIEAKAPGRIVNIASMAAFVCSGKPGVSLYSVTKAAVVRMTECLAGEWAPYDINVNAIAPGTFATEMADGMIEQLGDAFVKSFPRPRTGRPDQLDSTLLFLVSPASDFITGTCVKADDAQNPR